jgi:transcriptional regulator with XRE-family HTH domain
LLRFERYEVCHIDVLRSIDKNFTMSLPKLTGNLLRAGRALAGFTRDDLADRAGLSRDVLRSWEISSESIVPAQYQMLCRAIDALEVEGIRFSDRGVHLQRPTVIRSEGAAAA